MQAVAFDTLKLAQKLEKAGFPSKQAQDMAAAHADAAAEWQANINLATREDVQKLEAGLRQDMQKLEVGLRQNMQKLEVGLRQDMQKLDADLRQNMQKLEAQTNQRFAEVYQRIAEGKTETIKWVVGMAIALAGFMAALIKL
jgi:predicted  nucleic acid-binding Zn-ribbon protein